MLENDNQLLLTKFLLSNTKLFTDAVSVQLKIVLFFEITTTASLHVD